MSLNNSPNHPPLSSSSSRQFLRKAALSRPGTASSRPSDPHLQGQLPEGRLSTDDIHQLPDTTESPRQGVGLDGAHGQVEEYQEHQPASHPAFQPFFTLIEDAHTSDYHHPTVHYIFSDDDTDIVTEAALRSLAAQQEGLSDSKKDQIAQAQASNLRNETRDSSNLDQTKTTLLPPPIPGVWDNYVILDIEPSAVTPGAAQPIPIRELAPAKGGGETKSMSSSPANPSELPQEQSSSHQQYRVTAAQSFSPTWQVLNTEVVPAPTFENSNPGESPGHGLMLKIRGTSGFPVEVTGREKEGKLEEMMDQFAKRMSELQVIIDAAEGAEAANSRGNHVEEGVEQHSSLPDTAEGNTQGGEDNAAPSAEIEVQHP
ncbi:uncharacterized protein N7515_008973 [Penicillium bovifimosum]|uniref:Uncharacterized protein n=1 Tax=Penicillium bovifimosum TaxID=126998 RepID=A0A9W9KV23_9EURO|nr:uncharacterized protein N7515_008973 [Penicillium bovifimosum]KAJ5121012.1 hypothetical protein N7515_008973 [Penicillium bovifimosum]